MSAAISGAVLVVPDVAALIRGYLLPIMKAAGIKPEGGWSDLQDH